MPDYDPSQIDGFNWFGGLSGQDGQFGFSSGGDNSNTMPNVGFQPGTDIVIGGSKDDNGLTGTGPFVFGLQDNSNQLNGFSHGTGGFTPVTQTGLPGTTTGSNDYTAVQRLIAKTLPENMAVKLNAKISEVAGKFDNPKDAVAYAVKEVTGFDLQTGEFNPLKFVGTLGTAGIGGIISAAAGAISGIANLVDIDTPKIDLSAVKNALKIDNNGNSQLQTGVMPVGGHVGGQVDPGPDLQTDPNLGKDLLPQQGGGTNSDGSANIIQGGAGTGNVGAGAGAGNGQTSGDQSVAPGDQNQITTHVGSDGGIDTITIMAPGGQRYDITPNDLAQHGMQYSDLPDADMGKIFGGNGGAGNTPASQTPQTPQDNIPTITVTAPPDPGQINSPPQQITPQDTSPPDLGGGGSGNGGTMPVVQGPKDPIVVVAPPDKPPVIIVKNPDQLPPGLIDHGGAGNQPNGDDQKVDVTQPPPDSGLGDHGGGPGTPPGQNPPPPPPVADNFKFFAMPEFKILSNDFGHSDVTLSNG